MVRPGRGDIPDVVATMKSGVCPKCQGTSILANISLKDEFHNGFDSQVAVNPTPGTFFRVLVTSKIRAWVCEGCGYAEFYVAEPAKLGKAIDRAMADTKVSHNPRQDPHRL
jgi:predicted nucleic-acid-binding Zn-ribbon protein